MKRALPLAWIAMLVVAVPGFGQSAAGPEIRFPGQQDWPLCVDASRDVSLNSEPFSVEPLRWYALHVRLRRTPGVDLQFGLQLPGKTLRLDLQDVLHARATYTPAAPYDHDYVLWFLTPASTTKATWTLAAKPGAAHVERQDVVLSAVRLEPLKLAPMDRLGDNELPHGRWQGKPGAQLPRHWLAWSAVAAGSVQLQPDGASANHVLRVQSERHLLLGAEPVSLRLAAPVIYRVRVTVRGSGQVTVGVHGTRNDPPRRVADPQPQSFTVDDPQWQVLEHDWLQANPHVQQAQVYLSLQGQLELQEVELRPWLSP